MCLIASLNFSLKLPYWPKLKSSGWCRAVQSGTVPSHRRATNRVPVLPSEVLAVVGFSTIPSLSYIVPLHKIRGAVDANESVSAMGA